MPDCVPSHLLEALAGPAPGEKPAKPPPVPSMNGDHGSRSRLQVEAWLQDRGVEFRVKPERDRLGRMVWVLKQCPFNPTHGDPDSCVMQDRDGKLSAQCFHNSCGGMGWKEFKETIGAPNAGHYDPPLPRNARQDAELEATEKGPESSPKRNSGSSESHFRFEVVDSATFFSRDYRLSWLVKNILVAGQPAIAGGPTKSLKTSTIVDMAVSLGSGTPFLGHFEVPKAVRVAVLSGESGEATIQDAARRVCRARGLDPHALDVLWGFRLPRLSHPEDLLFLRAGLRERQVNVIFIDPLYLCLLSGQSAGKFQAGSLFDVGPLLLAVAETCLAEGVTPVLIHHTKKFSGANNDPLELQDLAFAGISEFARQWCLLSRREAFEEGTGLHKLWMVIGGSAGHSGLWSLDVNEGTIDDSFGGRNWDVAVRAGREQRNMAVDVKKQQRKEKESRQAHEDSAAVLSTLDKVAAPDGWAVYTKVRDGAHLATPRMTRAVLNLVEEGIVVEGSTTIKTGRNLKVEKEVNALRRVPNRD